MANHVPSPCIVVTFTMREALALLGASMDARTIYGSRQAPYLLEAETSLADSIHKASISLNNARQALNSPNLDQEDLK